MFIIFFSREGQLRLHCQWTIWCLLHLFFSWLVIIHVFMGFSLKKNPLLGVSQYLAYMETPIWVPKFDAENQDMASLDGLQGGLKELLGAGLSGPMVKQDFLGPLKSAISMDLILDFLRVSWI